ncbi:MAG TPA: hypothetical protein VKN76_06100, partial [Kiloniellaceae bacterium]|nr:hypothetical protein [Kiloniellaceae bacterium]
VKVTDTILHGAFVSDPNSAPAGIYVEVYKSSFNDNGVDEADQDGFFVEETGSGTVEGEVTSSYFLRNGSDGFGISEEGGGKVLLSVVDTNFRENGENIAKPGDPDDGLDIDEGAFGDVEVTIVDSFFKINFDDGIDLDERGGGNLVLEVTNTVSTRNSDQGVAVDERGDGDLVVDLIDSQVRYNDKGSQGYDLRAEQFDAGTGTVTSDNTDLGGTTLHNTTLVIVP